MTFEIAKAELLPSRFIKDCQCNGARISKKLTNLPEKWTAIRGWIPIG
jgi:hypothetical protein